MKLTTRISIVLIGLVTVTVTTVGFVTHRNLQRLILQTELSREENLATLLATRLENYVLPARQSVLSLRKELSDANDEMVLAVAHASQVTPESTSARESLNSRFSAEMESRPRYLQLRIIEAGGREVIRVERKESGGEIRVVPFDSLQFKGDRPYFNEAVKLPPDEIYVSPIELNQEFGKIEYPLCPVLRVASPIIDTKKRTIGIVVVNVALQPVLEEIRDQATDDRATYVVNGAGDYLVHPDRSREFGTELGHKANFWNDFPPVRFDKPLESCRNYTIGTNQIVVAPLWPGSRDGIFLARVCNSAAFLSSTSPVLNSSLFVGTCIVLGIFILAPIIARTLTKPLNKITDAISNFDGTNDIQLPTHVGGEIGALAQAFERISQRIKGQTEALKSEIAERQRAEIDLNQLAERERTFVAVVESCRDAILAMTKDGIVTAWNSAATALFGYSAAEILGKNVSVLVPDELCHEFRDAVSRVTKGENVYHYESIRISKTGQRLDVALSVSPILSPSGQIVGISKIIRDIRERRIVEQRFRQLFEATPAGLIMVNEKAEIELTNVEAERMFGYDREELRSRSVDCLVPNRFRENHVPERVKYLKDPSPRAMGQGRDLFGLRKDETEFPVEVALSPIRTIAGVQVLCSVVDITKRKEFERSLQDYANELKESNRQLEQFAYVVSHDIKAPLRGITSVAEWLSEDFGDVVDSDARENLELMVERTTRLNRLIDGILGYSRVGRHESSLTLVDVHALVSDVIISVRAPENIEISITGTLPHVTYDETQIRQVFQNLIDNAIKHLQKPTGKIVVWYEEDKLLWTFHVQDDGVGIPKRYHERIFELFQTLRPKDECHSAGAGLSIVKRIVELNGGTICVCSDENKGADFAFSIPKTMPRAD